MNIVHFCMTAKFLYQMLSHVLSHIINMLKSSKPGIDPYGTPVETLNTLEWQLLHYSMQYIVFYTITSFLIVLMLYL